MRQGTILGLTVSLPGKTEDSSIFFALKAEVIKYMSCLSPANLTSFDSAVFYLLVFSRFDRLTTSPPIILWYYTWRQLLLAGKLVPGGSHINIPGYTRQHVKVKENQK